MRKLLEKDAILASLWKVFLIDGVDILALATFLSLLLLTPTELSNLIFGMISDPWLVGLGADNNPIPSFLFRPGMGSPTTKTFQLRVAADVILVLPVS